MEAQDDVLIVIAKAPAEDVDAPRMPGIGLYPNPHADRAMRLDIDILERDVGDLEPIHIGAVLVDTPAFELAVLAALELPPIGRIDAAFVAEIAGRRPGADIL